MAELVDPRLPRDRFKRPLIVPPKGGNAVPYQRATTFAEMLEDQYKIKKWLQRMTALGMADDANLDLRVAALAARDDKGTLDEICDTAVTLAKGDANARRGTAMHTFTEKLDRGIDPGPVPDIVAADCEAYARATAGIVHERVECFTVIDELRIGGTPDRVSVLPDGRRVIFDLKTGDSIEYGMGKICLQLALYSRGMLYDVETHERTPLDVDQNVAVVAWLPFGQAMCTLVEIDIAAGWEACQLAARVKDWRRRRDTSRPLASRPPTPTAPTMRPRRLLPVPPVAPHVNRATGEIVELPEPDPVTVLGGHNGDHGPGPAAVEPAPAPVDALANRIASAATVAELEGIWRENRDSWTDRYQEVAKLRKTLIESALV